MAKITVILADDHTVVRQGLKALLSAEPDIEVVGEVETGREAVEMVAKLLPDIVVMDIAMPQLNGLEATRQILSQTTSTRVIILSSYNDEEYVEQLTNAGATGYLIKQTAANDLIRAIHEAKLGNAFFSPAIARRMLDHCRRAFLDGKPPSKKAVSLTTREREVLQLIAEGMTNKAIGGELCISIKTVEKHRQQVMNKLNIHDIAGLTRYAISRGVIESKSALNPV
ncbi:MAG: response regulator transcription factor [Opitutales bacterium]|nr:response regulator transcription factor [Opitutales bacterium]